MSDKYKSQSDNLDCECGPDCDCDEHTFKVLELDDEKFAVLDELDFEGRHYAIITPYPEVQIIEVDGENFTFLEDEELTKRLKEHMDEISPEFYDDDEDDDFDEDDEDDDFDEDDDEQEIEVIEFEDENGKNKKYEVLDELDFEDRHFSIIAPYPELQIVEDDGKSITFLEDEELIQRIMEYLDEIAEELEEDDE